MKHGSIGRDHVCYRVLTPSYSHLPTSGAGAARKGGRFNEPGTAALYLALEKETALDEYSQAQELFGPGTMVCYHVTLANVVDFSMGYDPNDWSPLWRGWDCDWQQIVRLHQGRPPTWEMAAKVLAHQKPRFSGLLFPATRRPGGTNLVIYLDRLAAGDKVSPYDPDGQLPRDDSSWSKPVDLHPELTHLG